MKGGFGVTDHTRGRRSCISALGVAGAAGDRVVGSCEGEAGRPMVECQIIPTGGGVAGLTFSSQRPIMPVGGGMTADAA
jgi:hypothetical protein